jgi:hypothetical protein
MRCYRIDFNNGKVFEATKDPLRNDCYVIVLDGGKLMRLQESYAQQLGVIITETEATRRVFQISCEDGDLLITSERGTSLQDQEEITVHELMDNEVIIDRERLADIWDKACVRYGFVKSDQSKLFNHICKDLRLE